MVPIRHLFLPVPLTWWGRGAATRPRRGHRRHPCTVALLGSSNRYLPPPVCGGWPERTVVNVVDQLAGMDPLGRIGEGLRENVSGLLVSDFVHQLVVAGH